MIDQLAKCGCDCLNCPTYKENILAMDSREKCSAGWSKYLNIKLSPEKLRACDGCSIPDSERKTYYLNCKIRQCAMINEIENCAYCRIFPCDELLKVHSVQTITNRAEFTRQTGRQISEEDYNFFIEPYAGLQHLNKISKTISDDKIKDYKKFTNKVKTARFDNSVSNPETLRKIHSLLAGIGIESEIPFARLRAIEKNREQIMKILWAAGSRGTLLEKDGVVELDSLTFLSQEISCMYSGLLDYFTELKKYDVHCEITPLVEKGWLTPMGALRKTGWKFKLKFGETLNGTATLVIFLEYARKLQARFDNKAFKLFKIADLSVMND